MFKPSVGMEIANLMMDTRKSAADMTHAVKALGNGDMQRGLAQIGAYFADEIAEAEARGLARGRIEGGVAVAIGILAVGGIIACVKHKRKKRAEHESEGQIIRDTIDGKRGVVSEDSRRCLDDEDTSR